MNKEERKAIEYYQDKEISFGVNFDTEKLLRELGITEDDSFENHQIRFKTLLNLIEKLQKENEELKEYIAIAPNLDEMTATKYRNIQQDAYIQGRAEEQQKAEQIIYENYIPIQKIKDRISERQFELQQEYKDFEDDAILIVLQELIEEREEK